MLPTMHLAVAGLAYRDSVCDHVGSTRGQRDHMVYFEVARAVVALVA